MKYNYKRIIDFTNTQHISHILILLVVSFISQLVTFNCYGQNFSLESKTDFQQYIYQQEKHFNTIIKEKGDDHKIEGYKSFKRWRARYQEETYNDGGLANVLNSQNYFNHNYETIKSNFDTYEAEWEELGPFSPPLNHNDNYGSASGTGRIFFIEFDPNNSNRIFAGSPTGGLYISNDHGETWQNGGTDNLPNPGVSHFQMAPATNEHPETWFILTGDGDNSWSFSYGVFRSIDQGGSWENISDGIFLPPLEHWNKAVGRKLLINPNNPNELFVIFNYGLYKTNNALETDAMNVHWFIKKVAHFTDICSKPNSNNQVLYAATTDTIYQSTDYGNTWDYMPNQNQIVFLDTTENRRITLRTTPANPKILYAVIISNKDSAHSQIYKYNTTNQNWNKQGNLMVKDFAIGWGRYQAFAVSPTTENILYQARVSAIHQSLDAGISWQTKSAAKHDDTHWICFENNDPQKIWLGTDGGVSYSPNACDTLLYKTNNISVGNITRISSGETLTNHIIFGGFDTGSNLTKGNNEWTLIGGGDAYGSIVDDTDPSNPIYYISANGGSPSISTNGAVSFSSLHLPETIRPNGWNHSLIKDYNTQSTIYYAGRKRIARSTNKGNTWSAISELAGDTLVNINLTETDTVNYIYWEVFNSKNHPNYLYTYRVTGITDWEDDSANVLYKTTNANAADPNQVVWENITPIINGEIQEYWWTDIAVNHENPDEIWVCKSGYKNYDPKIIHYKNNQWEDISSDPNNTLEYLSVSAIKKVQGSDDLLIIGTNAGVFFKSNSHPNWTKMEGIPNARVTEIRIQETVKKILVSTYGRGLWRADIPCINPTANNNITSNTTWSNDTIISGNVYIKSGNRLTIENCKIQFAPDKKIIVEKGSELFVDNAILDSRCNELWGGIQVLGNSKLSQSPSSNQGAVKTYNNTEIRHAWIGIKAYGLMDEPSSGGGIVLATDTKFINCRKGMALWYYQNNNNSIIRDCEFVITNHLNDNISNPVGIDLYRYSTMAITDNNFNNTNTTLSSSSKGKGIYIRSANATINKKTIGNHFSGWNYGIYASASVPGQYIGIKNNSFENCITGIYLSGTSNTEVVFNDFNLMISQSSAHFAGLYINSCHNFTVEENYFHSNYSNISTLPSIGLVVNNSGSYNNIIYKNNFDRIKFATLAQNQNRGANTGLTFKCNVYTNNGYDITVTAQNSGSNMGIAANQGSMAGPAGNIFSWRGPMGTPTDLNNEENFFTYYYHDNDNYNLKPEYYTENTINIIPSTTPWNENSCPSNYGGGSGGGIGTIKGNMTSSGAASDSLNSIYQALKDGGNTIALQTEVDNSIPPESMEVYNELMGTSPYLSDTVIASSIYKENVLPNAMLRDVMVANPQSAKNKELIENIDDRSQNMPDYMKAQILQGKSLIGAMETLLSAKAYHQQKRAEAYRQCVNYYINDTLTPQASYDSLMLVLSQEPQLEAHYHLAALYLQKGDIEEVNTTFEHIGENFNMNTIELEAYSQMQNYFALLISIYENNLSLENLNEQQLVLLADLEYSGNGTAQVFARNMRLNMGLSTYKEPYLLPDLNKSTEAQMTEQNLMQSLEDFHYIKIFPNPAKDYILVEYTLDSHQQQALLQLTTLSGKNIYSQNIYGLKDQKHIDTHHLKSGNYLLSLVVNETILETLKVSIIK